ncbi:MAG TPA: hypothetical protein VKQ30_19190 [Ktedonobacterales bacterium]|nr:hypothetical protein [Ktedonobacterales bacterium]
MRNPPRRRPIPIRRPSWLDQWVYRFQHRWETNAQYRAAVSGVCGLLLIVLMCSCTGILATVTNSAFAGAGGGNSGGLGNTNTGAANVQAQATFPTMTIPPYTVSTIQAGSIPDSQTPPPGPTATPTDLPATPTDTPGGGGGGPQGACSGASGGGTWQLSPCPQTHGQSGSLIIQDAAYANHTVNIVISFGQCSGTTSCTYLYTPAQGYHLDGNGYMMLTYTVPQQAQPNVAPESGMVNITNGPTITFTGPYIQ